MDFMSSGALFIFKDPFDNLNCNKEKESNFVKLKFIRYQNFVRQAFNNRTIQMSIWC